jgi:broad specificity phosphatase PhoE
MAHRFYFIRHAESTGNLHPEIIGGRSNHLHLSQTGVEQAQTLAQNLRAKGISFDGWYCSPAIRTVQTFERLATGLSLKENAITDNDLQELSQGEWEGKPRALHHTPEMLKHINQDSWNFKPPQGESQHEVGKRMYCFLEKLIANTLPGHYAIVGHGIAIRSLMRYIFEAEESYLTLHLGNTSLTILSHFSGQWKAEAVNINAEAL